MLFFAWVSYQTNFFTQVSTSSMWHHSLFWSLRTLCILLVWHKTSRSNISGEVNGQVSSFEWRVRGMIPTLFSNDPQETVAGGQADGDDKWCKPEWWRVWQQSGDLWWRSVSRKSWSVGSWVTEKTWQLEAQRRSGKCLSQGTWNEVACYQHAVGWRTSKGEMRMLISILSADCLWIRNRWGEQVFDESSTQGGYQRTRGGHWKNSVAHLDHDSFVPFGHTHIPALGS